jgi:hypothetical protein
MTGSTVRKPSRPPAARSTVIRTRARVPSIPVFVASTVMSSSTESNWSDTKSVSTGWTRLTPCVFCATSPVMTVVP